MHVLFMSFSTSVCTFDTRLKMNSFISELENLCRFRVRCSSIFSPSRLNCWLDFMISFLINFPQISELNASRCSSFR